MRLALAFVVTAFLALCPVTFGASAVSALVPAAPSDMSNPSLLRDAKIVCGDFGEGYTCRRESGSIRRGKNIKVPGASSGGSSEAQIENSDPDALPPASGGTAYPAQSAPPATCPSNTEMLAGHCIPYTQTCNRGLAANANPQACRGAEEKQVCSFRPDGLKDCCCRTYSKF
ncbi:MAG TPA: hypothetical protein VMW57_01975 [Methyloceanibacter sp.]|nr:hypothetical protein [Methyloceanibacter sp.]